MPVQAWLGDDDPDAAHEVGAFQQANGPPAGYLVAAGLGLMITVGLLRYEAVARLVILVCQGVCRVGVSFPACGR
jgi:hypothetical protein